MMGDSLPEIADTLSNTIPKGGVLFTADETMAARLRSHAEVLGSRSFWHVPLGMSRILILPKIFPWR